MSKAKARFTTGKAKKDPKPRVPAEQMPQNPQQLEVVLASLLAPDTREIEAATKVMDTFLKSASSIPALVQQIAQSTNPHARQMAAVLLRRVIVKHFRGISQADQAQVKSVLLSRLLEEPQRLVRHSIGVLISTLAATLVPKNQWNDLLDQLLALCQHPSESHREIAMMLFSALAENLTSTLKKHFNQLFDIFSRGLSDASVKVRTEALTALSTLVDMLDEDEPERIAAFSTVIEPLIQVMSVHSDNDDILAAGFEVLDCLAESSTGVLDPFIPKITEFMCQIAMSNGSAAGTREKAAFLVTDIIRHKSHKLLKPTNIIPSLLQVSYQLVCEPFDDDDEEYITPQALGIEILDAILLNLHIPKKDIFPSLMAKINELIQSPAPDQRKGGLVIMAVMAEGCSTLVADQLATLVPVACKLAVSTPGNDSPLVKVRVAACIVIEQFADHLHPDISQFHDSILPCLMQVLTNPGEHDMVKEKCCSALDVFCQHLDSDIGRYITVMMPALMAAVSDPLMHVSRSAISAIKAVAYAAKERFEPYLNSCMTIVGAFLMKNDEESLRQRCRATECIGAMGVAVGKARFCQPMSDQPGQNFYDISFHMVMESFKLNYFELRESSYLYFSDMCEMMGHDFAPRLPMVMPLVLSSLFTDDGIEIEKAKASFNESDDGGISSDDDEEAYGSDSDDDVDDERRQRVTIRSGALDEKIAALSAITTIVPLVRTEDFKVYVRSTSKNNDVFTALWELSEYPHPYIRAANVQAIRELLMWFHRAMPPATKWNQGENVPLHASVKDMVEELTLLIVERMDEEDDRQCAAEACDALGEVLQKFGTIVLQQTVTIGEKRDQIVPMPKHLLDLLIRFLQEKAPSQIPEEVEDESERAEIEDHDFVLMESVSDLIAILAEVMGASFEPGFRQMFPIMQRFLKPEKQAPTKGMAIGCFAEIIHWLTVPGQATHPLIEYFPSLITYAQASLADPSPLVRRNGAFCSGCMLQIPHPGVLQAYPTFLQLLGNAYTPASGPVDPNAGIVNGSLKDEEFLGARDNACSAICKMMVTSPQSTGQPMSTLIEMVLTGLPLECDFNEAKSVYPAIMNLYRTHPADITPHTDRVVSIFARVFGNPDIDTAIQRDIIAFCKELVRQAPQQLEGIFAKLPADQQTAFKSFIIDQLAQ